MKKQLLTKLLLAVAMLGVGSMSAWADDWTTVWSADLASAPSGMTYSVTSGSVDITNGYIHYNQGGGSGDRAINTAFTADAFNVNTNWKMEFDWGCGSANTNSSYVTFATDNGNAFTLTWAKYASGVVVTDAAANQLSTTVPLEGYNKHTCTVWNHIVITGNTESGIYLTITKGDTKYVDNVLVTSTFGYPKTFNGSLGKAVSAMFVDNLTFATPKVAGFVATPTGTITKAAGTSRKFTLSCLTDGAAIYYSESDIEIGAAGWNTYSSEVTTSAATIYVYASDGVNNSIKGSFETGAGTTVGLATPTISASGFSNTTGISVTNPTFNFACNNSAVLGTPTATLSYTFTPDGGAESSETAGTSYAPTAYGILKVIASADGYASSEKSLIVSNLYTVSYAGRDYTAATRSDDFTTWGDSYSVEWTGWETGLTAYLSATAVSDDNHLNIQNENTISLVEGWGWVRGDQKTYGYRVRYAKEGEFIALKENTSKGSDSDATTYQTVYSTSGSGIQTDLITITAPAGYAIQQLFHYVAAPATISATITAAGWATLYTPYALDFSDVEGLTAYTATVAGSTVTLTPVANVPANTGVVLKGEANTYNIPVIASSETAKGDLIGSATEATACPAESGTYYILTAVAEGVQFNPATSGSIAAGKAFLSIPSTARPLTVVFGDDATGIKTLDSGKAVTGFYNLAGQRVAQPKKGLYIERSAEGRLQGKNGKKIIVK